MSNMPLRAISSLSLGSCAHHSLYIKLQAAKNAGFTAIDLYGDDWDQFKVDYAKAADLAPSRMDGDHTSIEAAKEIRRLCAHFGLKLLCLQPFRDLEGRIDPTEALERMVAARGTLSVLPHLGTDMLLIPSTTLPAEKVTNDFSRIAEDLAELADHASAFSPPLRVCYEALSWGTHISTWRDAWEVVRMANRTNLGLCLDSFNTAARQWADPYKKTGKRHGRVDEELRRDLAELVKIVPPHRIFYFQIADGKLMQPPMNEPLDPNEPRLRPWSRGYRLFPLEMGAYLPVKEFTEAVMELGYNGPWCIEVFNNSLHDANPTVPSSHAGRAIRSLIALENTVGLRDERKPDTWHFLSQYESILTASPFPLKKNALSMFIFTLLILGVGLPMLLLALPSLFPSSSLAA
ncbi:hypothetical protein M422DRAFT_204028 [Sphaerobolus stellatus SS14]|nr:hypothetical protein M422DRAFT_204028 [Sphaerobolus stellatus SS14]